MVERSEPVRPVHRRAAWTDRTFRFVNVQAGSATSTWYWTRKDPDGAATISLEGFGSLELCADDAARNGFHYLPGDDLAACIDERAGA